MASNVLVVVVDDVCGMNREGSISVTLRLLVLLAVSVANSCAGSAGKWPFDFGPLT